MIEAAADFCGRLYYILIGIGIFFPSGQNFYFRFVMSEKNGLMPVLIIFAKNERKKMTSECCSKMVF